MSLGQKITKIRKEKKLSQVDIASYVGVSRDAISKYERDEVKPSIEMATQLAEALEISLDYLVGSTNTLLEKSIVTRVLDIQKLKENEKQHVFALLDAFLKQSKLQSIM
jgi:transcriptional regulator with XRE-family HTH domain